MIADARERELAGNLAAVRDRIDVACRAAGRDPDEVTLIVVTKTYPAADVIRLATLGVTDIGENRDQEAAPKAVEVAAKGVTVRWHFVGRLQRNKCRSVARYAGMVHSVDSVRLAQALGAAARRERDDRPIDVLVQVSLDGDASRGGAVPAGVASGSVAAGSVAAGGVRPESGTSRSTMSWPRSQPRTRCRCAASWRSHRSNGSRNARSPSWRRSPPGCGPNTHMQLSFRRA